MVREKINKQLTVNKARLIIGRALTFDATLKQEYVKKVANTLYENRVFNGEAYEADERKAEKVIEKLFGGKE